MNTLNLSVLHTDGNMIVVNGKHLRPGRLGVRVSVVLTAIRCDVLNGEHEQAFKFIS